MKLASKLIIALLVVATLGLVGWRYSQDNPPGTIRLVGTLTSDAQPPGVADLGNQYIVKSSDGDWTVGNCGFIDLPRGKVEAKVGDRVEVFGKSISDHVISICGSEKYHIKKK